MKIVLDTNVLIAALIAHGVCSDLLEHCATHHTLITSDFIYDELRENLVRKFRYDSSIADEIVNLMRSKMTAVLPVKLDPPVCRDQDDDMILATALVGEAACIITGDKDLLAIKRFQKMDIIRPSDFAEYELQASG